MTPFGEKLRALRAERGVSQKAMASAIAFWLTPRSARSARSFSPNGVMPAGS